MLAELAWKYTEKSAPLMSRPEPKKYQNMLIVFSDVKPSLLEILFSAGQMESEERQPRVLVEKHLGK